MPDLPSFRELFRIAEDEVVAGNAKITRDSVERAGTDANALVAGAAGAADEVTGQLAQVAASLFIDSARGLKLDRLVFDRYGITRKPASVARGSVDFVLTAPNPSPFSIPANTSLQTTDGKKFLTVAAASVPFGSVGPITVAVRSALAGRNQQARAATITNILDSISGAPNGLTCSNSLATAGADGSELDDDLRARAKLFFPTARRGTVAAIQAAALDIAGVRRATAFEVLDAFGRPAKSVQLVVADAFTDSLVNVVPTPAAYATQSQTLAQAVFEGLIDVRADGIFVDVMVAQVVLQGIVLGLRFTAGVNADSAALRARAAIVQVINSLAPSTTLTIAAMIAVLRTVPGLIVTGQEILSPSGDVVPQQLQVLRTTLGLVVASTMQPDRALQGSSNPDPVGR